MKKIVTLRLLRVLPQVYAAAAVRLLLPLLVLPLVASRVGTEEFGHLGFILVWATLLSTIVEGGFIAAATRVAVTADPARQWQIAQQVFSARCVLCVPVVLLAVAVVVFAGNGLAHPAIDALGIAALACGFGWPATWYLQASQQLGRWARVELVVYGAMIAAGWAFAYSVQVYLLLQFAASLVLALLGWAWLRRDFAELSGKGRDLWCANELRPGLRLGWTMLPVALAGAAYSVALPAAASLQLARSELGIYYLADRLVRAVLNAFEPVFAVVYPRIVTLFGSGARAALRYAAGWSIAGVLGGAAVVWIGLLAWPVIAPLVVARAGNLDIVKVRDVALILSGLLPLLLGWKFIGYWMLGSRRFDRAYRASMIVGGIVGVGAAATIGGAAGAIGLAWTALATECVVIAVAVGGVLLTQRHRLRG